MGVAAYIILLASTAAFCTRMLLVRESFHASVEFGTLVLSVLSFVWLGWVLAKSAHLTDAKFGKLVRHEMPTVMLALTLSLFYSVARLIGILFPWPNVPH